METETITIKMTWENTLPSLLLLLESGTAEGKQTAKEELARMAKAADQAVELAGSESETPQGQ